jgi:hypothetical protein
MSNVIIVSYPEGSGGKCIANCLGLSNSATIMDHYLSYADVEDKSNYFTQKFKESLQNAKWNDLDLGSIKFVGHTLDFNDSFTPDDLSTVYDELYIRDEFKKLLQGPKDIYLVAHSASATRFYREHYNSSRVIRLVNATNVVYKRPKYINGSSAMSKETFRKLCNNVENAIGEFIPWDCEWFSDVDVFLTNMEKLYARLGYKDFLVAEPHIKNYYKHWAKIVYMVL